MTIITIIKTFYLLLFTHLPFGSPGPSLLTPCSQQLQTTYAEPHRPHIALLVRASVDPKASPTRSHEMDVYDLDQSCNLCHGACDACCGKGDGRHSRARMKSSMRRSPRGF